MIKVSDAVETQVRSDFSVLDALQRRVLNYSAYAKSIRPQIEELTMKEVQLGSIVTSLSRLAPVVGSEKIKPDVKLNNVSIRSPLVDISYDRNAQILERVSHLRQQLDLQENDFFTITEGDGEVTLIAPERLQIAISAALKNEPKAIYRDLVGVTVRFSSEYLAYPNTIFSILGVLAAKKINLIEILSTLTSLALVVERHQSEATVQALQKFLR